MLYFLPELEGPPFLSSFFAGFFPFRFLLEFCIAVTSVAVYA